MPRRSSAPVGSGPVPKKLYAVGAEFAGPKELYAAAEKVRDQGFKWLGLLHALLYPRPRQGDGPAQIVRRPLHLRAAAWPAWSAASCSSPSPRSTSIPIDTQGKPFFSLPGFVPILDLLMILLSAIMSIVGMTMLCVLPRLHHPLWEWDAFTPRHPRQVLHRHRGQRSALQRKGRDRPAARNRRHESHLHRRRGMKLRYFFLALVAGRDRRRRRSPAFAAITSRKPPFEIFPDMNYQDKVKDQVPSAFFADGNSARAPIPGTVAEEMPAQNDYWATGKWDDTHWGDGIPVHDASDGGRAAGSRRRRTWRAAASATPSVARSATARPATGKGITSQVRPQRRGQLPHRPPAPG